MTFFSTAWKDFNKYFKATGRLFAFICDGAKSGKNHPKLSRKVFLSKDSCICCHIYENYFFTKPAAIGKD